MLRRILTFGLLVCASAAAGREPGTVFYRCSAGHLFTLPGAWDRPVRMSSGSSGHIRTVEQQESAERIFASIDVEEDGSTSGLSLQWVQNGFSRSGRLWRSDLDVFMTARFGAALPWTQDRPERFDAAAVEIEVRLHLRRRIRPPAYVRVYRGGERSNLLSLGGLAEIPDYHPTTASVSARWRDLEAFAAGGDRLHVALSRRPQTVGPSLAFGMLDLRIMPRVIEHFRAAESAVRAVAAEARTRCERRVEPEPEEEML